MSFVSIGLFNPKTPANIGGVLRAMECYGAQTLAICGKRYKPHATDTTKAIRRIPTYHFEDLKMAIPFGCVPVAVELLPEAESLIEYKHPKRAFYILGPEDGSLGKQITSWCRDVIYIPTEGCMNLAATVNVLLYDRLAKGKL